MIIVISIVRIETAILGTTIVIIVVLIVVVIIVK